MALTILLYYRYVLPVQDLLPVPYYCTSDLSFTKSTDTTVQLYTDDGTAGAETDCFSSFSTRSEVSTRHRRVWTLG
eukprot:COSAG01_NODE_3236_length_6351_cov_4.282823_1_plen_76_part_00